MGSTPGISRRQFLEDSPVVAAGALAALQWPAVLGAEAPAPHQAMGTKVGEVTDTSAIVWTRLTASPTRNNSGVPMQGQIGRKVPQEITVPVAALEGACPGAPGPGARSLRDSCRSLGCDGDRLGRGLGDDRFQPPVPHRRPAAGDGLLLCDRDHRPGRLAPARRIPRHIRDRPPARGADGAALLRDDLPGVSRPRPQGWAQYLSRDGRPSAQVRRIHRRQRLLRQRETPRRQRRAGAAPLAANVKPSAAGGAAQERRGLLGKRRPRHRGQRFVARQEPGRPDVRSRARRSTASRCRWPRTARVTAPSAGAATCRSG